MGMAAHTDDFRFDPDAGGLVLVDKPLTWTSFDVVGKLRGAMRIAAGRKIKVGHAGTLDPLASGLLILAYGPMTKQLPLITGQEKGYTGTITLGAVTPSYDLETTPEPTGPWEHFSARHTGRLRPVPRGGAATPAGPQCQTFPRRARLLPGPRCRTRAPGGDACREGAHHPA